MLADSPWPRTGRDPRNSGLAPFAGPIHGQVVQQCDLSVEGSVVCAENGYLLVSGERTLIAVDRAGKPSWRIDFEDRISPALALQDGFSVVHDRCYAYLISPEGQLRARSRRLELLYVGGISPNVHPGGLLLSGREGNIWLLRRNKICKLTNCFGFDVLPPAVYRDGNLGAAGYYGSGPTRLGVRGNTIWQKRDEQDADLLVSLNRFDEMAVGVLNCCRTMFFSRGGVELFRAYDAGLCAEHPLGWVVAGQRVGLYSRHGQLLWQHEHNWRRGWGENQPVVDGQGNIYLVHTSGVIGYRPDGSELFELDGLSRQPGNLILSGPGEAAFVADGTLYRIH